MRAHWTIGVALGLAFALAGCGKKDKDKDAKAEREKIPHAFSLLDADKDTDSTAVSVSHGTATIPPNFPKDVPVPDKAAVSHVASDRNQTAVNMTVATSVREVTVFYKSTLKEKGWEVSSQIESPVQAILSATKEGRIVSVALGQADGKTTIELAVTGTE
jgi:hypothetical protein